MKKIKSLRIAALLLIAVLITACVISGTFAKYVTKTEKTNNARVAKWGVVFEAGSDLFGTTYATDDDTYSSAIEFSVVSSDAVVAPGTEGTAAIFALSSAIQPEVSYKVSFDVDTDSSATVFTEWCYTDETNTAVTSTAIYYPVVFTLSLGGEEVASSASLSDLKASVASCGILYDVGEDKYLVSSDGINYEDYTGTGAPSVEINWSWSFEGNDQADTFLGNAIVDDADTFEGKTKGTDYNTTVTFKFIAKATQID